MLPARADLTAPPLPPVLPTRHPLGHLPALRRDVLGTFLAAQPVGDVVRIRTGHVHVYAVFHPDLVEQVLVGSAAKYAKHTRGYDKLRLVLGDGLVTSEGAHWRRQRRIANPAFHRECLEGFAGTMQRWADWQVEQWAPGGPTDVSRDMTELTLRIAGETMFGAALDAEVATVGAALDAILPRFQAWVSAPYPWPELVPSPANLRFRAALRGLDGVVERLVASRRASGVTRPDLLGLLMDTTDDDGARMTDAQLRDEVVTLLLAGHETTANALTWTFHLLARHPDVVERLRAELAFLNGRPPGFADLPRLTYTLQVVQEAMRLYPPVWAVARSAVEPDVLGGYAVPAGTFVYMSQHAIHRNPAFWPDPERFDPDRFAPERSVGRPRGAYLPFSLGQRKCIGDRFALMEAQIVLGALVPRFDVRVTRPPVPRASLVLKPRDGLAAVIAPR